MEWLENIDRSVTLLINEQNCGSCDFIFLWASSRVIWTLFYAVLLVALYREFGSRILTILMAVALLILLSDQLSVLIKETVMRYRPCHNLNLKDRLHLVDGCGGLYGFVSSHAANSMALASFLALVAGRRIGFLVPALAAYVMLIGYSRIYLGRHYASDVIGGWLLGLLVSLIIFYFYKKLTAVHDRRK